MSFIYVISSLHSTPLSKCHMFLQKYNADLFTQGDDNLL